MVGRSRFLGMVLAVMLCLPVSLQAAPTYEGSLAYSSGIDATGSWANASTVFSWLVSSKEYKGSNYWHYAYTFSVLEKGISHLILGVSDGLLSSEIVGIEANVGYKLEGPIGFGSHTRNPNIPGDVYGIKFDLTANTKELTFSFYSLRSPMLGDFYAKDGKDKIDVTAWNSGFSDMANPLYDRYDLGSYAEWGKILVPNTHTVVPAPGAILLTGIGTTLVGWLRRRRRI